MRTLKDLYIFGGIIFLPTAWIALYMSDMQDILRSPGLEHIVIYLVATFFFAVVLGIIASLFFSYAGLEVTVKPDEDVWAKSRKKIIIVCVGIIICTVMVHVFGPVPN